MNKVYNNIYELRKAKGLSQMDLADKLNINQDSVSKLERGKIQLTIERLELLAEIFGMTVFEIMQYGGETVQQPQIVDNDKVKELENKVLLLEKDLEICRMNIKINNTYKNIVYVKIIVSSCKELVKRICSPIMPDLFEKLSPKSIFLSKSLKNLDRNIFCNLMEQGTFTPFEERFFYVVDRSDFVKSCGIFYDNYGLIYNISQKKMIITERGLGTERDLDRKFMETTIAPIEEFDLSYYRNQIQVVY